MHVQTSLRTACASLNPFPFPKRSISPLPSLKINAASVSRAHTLEFSESELRSLCRADCL